MHGVETMHKTTACAHRLHHVVILLQQSRTVTEFRISLTLIGFSFLVIFFFIFNNNNDDYAVQGRGSAAEMAASRKQAKYAATDLPNGCLLLYLIYLFNKILKN